MRPWPRAGPLIVRPRTNTRPVDTPVSKRRRFFMRCVPSPGGKIVVSVERRGHGPTCRSSQLTPAFRDARSGAPAVRRGGADRHHLFQWPGVIVPRQRPRSTLSMGRRWPMDAAHRRREGRGSSRDDRLDVATEDGERYGRGTLPSGSRRPARWRRTARGDAVKVGGHAHLRHETAGAAARPRA